MFRLKRIHLRNWMTVVDQTVSFPEYGLVVVNGRNEANSSKFSSIGSGKTALGESIAVALLGIQGRYSHLGDYSRKSAGNMLVDLEGTLDNEVFNIRTGYKCSELSRTGGALVYSKASSGDVSRAKMSDTRADIDSMLHNDALLSQWTTHIDGGWLQFGDLSQRNLIDLLMQALNQPAWDQLYAKAHSNTLAVQTLCTRLRAELEYAKSELAENEKSLPGLDIRLRSEDSRVQAEERRRLELLATANVKLDRVNSNYANLQEAQEQLVQKIHLESQQHQQAIETFTADTIKVNSDVDSATQKYNLVMEQRSQARASLQELQRRLQEVEGYKPSDRDRDRISILQELRDIETYICTILPEEDEACTRIHSVIAAYTKILESEDIPVGNKGEAMRLELEKARTCLSEIDKTFQRCSALLSEARSGRDEAFKKRPKAPVDRRAELNDGRRALASLDVTREDLRAQIQRLSTPTQSEVNAILALIDDRKSRIKKTKASINEIEAKLSNADYQYQLSQYWESAFNPTGIPNAIIERSVSMLNDVSRQISQAMTGGSIVVSYQTTAMRVSGAAKPRLSVNVENRYGSVHASGNSKGETGLTNLIVAETLAEVARVPHRIGYRWYDEITNGQDSQVRSSIFAYLKGVAASKHLLIFLVDHSPEAGSFADYTLTAVKNGEDGGVTTFEWS